MVGEQVGDVRTMTHSSHLSSILKPAMLARLEQFFCPRVTGLIFADYAPGWTSLSIEQAKQAGVSFTGHPITVAVKTPGQRIGNITIQHDSVSDSCVLFDNVNWVGNLHTHIRVSRSGCVCAFNLRGNSQFRLQNSWLRSEDQTLFWGAGATAVFLNFVEIEGAGHSVIVGDDALISVGVHIRNHDMHSIVNLETRERTNEPVNTVLERHVWIGQDVLMLGCRSIGYGSIVGAGSLVKGSLPPKVIAGGTPARVLRQNRSWGRSAHGMNEAEMALLKQLDKQTPRAP